jgi:hypothetical protein
MIAIASQSMERDLGNPCDRQMHAAATTALAASKYGPLRKLDCRVSAGVVEITGSVPSFYLKQLAQAAVLQLYPSSVIRNLVRVHGESSVFVAKSCDDPQSGET